MAVITGARATAGATQINANTRVVDMSDTIHLLDPNLAPLTAVTMKLRKAHAISPKVEWLEDDYLPSSDTLNEPGGVLAGDTTITVDNGSYFRIGDVLKHLDSGEVLLVTGVSSNDLTVTRSVGGTAASAMDDADVLLIIGNANAENSLGRTLKTTQKTNEYNYTQIFRWPFGASGTLQASELYGGDDMAYQTRKAGLEHRIQMERSFLFGERSENTSGATALRTCGGVIERITSNVTNLNGNLTLSAMETWLKTLFRYGPAAKMLFASRDIVSYLNLIAIDGGSAKLQTVPSTRSFPLALTEYVSGHGKLYIVTHNLLEGAGANNQSYGRWALGLDLDSIYYRYLQGRDTQIRQHIEENDRDGRVDEYLTEACPMLIQEKNHSIINDIDGYA